MPNIALVLKSEIARLARREVRAETDSLKKASAQYRSSIAALKREVAALEKQIKRLPKSPGRQLQEHSEQTRGKIRYSSKRLAAHRAKLGLSAKDYGSLIGVSALTIYKWEGGSVRPRAGQLSAIASVRKLGKREAQASLGRIAALTLPLQRPATSSNARKMTQFV